MRVVNGPSLLILILGAALSVSDVLTFLERRCHVDLNFLCGQCAVVDAHLIE
jgi:hypothetical protein